MSENNYRRYQDHLLPFIHRVVDLGMDLLRFRTASGGAMVDGPEIVYTVSLEPFRPSRIHLCKVYVNVILRKL